VGYCSVGAFTFFLRATHPLTVSLSDTVTPDLGSEIMERCKSRIGFRIHLSDWNVLNPFAHKILVQFLSVSYIICKLIYRFLIYLFFRFSFLHLFELRLFLTYLCPPLHLC